MPLFTFYLVSAFRQQQKAILDIYYHLLRYVKDISLFWCKKWWSNHDSVFSHDNSLRTQFIAPITDTEAVMDKYFSNGAIHRNV